MSESAMSYPRDIPPMWFLAGLGFEVILDRFWPVRDLCSWPWTLSGAFVIGLGMSLLVWSAGLFRRAGTGVRPFTEATALVARGPFRFSRNPMYLAMVVMLCGVALTMGSLSPWVVPPLFLWLIQQRFVRREEAFLTERFGDDYRELCRNVRRWL